MFVELQRVEECYQFVDRHAYQLGDVAAADLDVESLFAQARPAALGTCSLARIACLHHAELDLAALAVDILEELVQTVEIFVAAPQQQFLFGREVVVRLVYREVELVGVVHKLLLPPLHRGAAPAGYGSVVYCLALVGYDQILVYAYDLAVAFASRTCSDRVVEAEKVLGGLLESYAVGFETCREGAFIAIDDDAADVVAIAVCTCYGVAQTQQCVVVRSGAQTVHDKAYGRRIGLDVDRGHELLHGEGLSVDPYAQEAFREQLQQLLYKSLTGFQMYRADYDHTFTVSLFGDVVHDVVDAVTPHLASRYGRKGVSDTGEEQFHVVVYLGRGADRRARVARIDLLLDGYGGGYARYVVYVGFVDASQKLSGVCRQALNITALPLGKDGVEGQCRFTRSR